MENKDLKIVPEIEIVRFGPLDWLKKSLDDNETIPGPGGSFTG